MDTMVYFLNVDPTEEPRLATEAGVMALAEGLSENRKEKIRSMRFLSGKRQSLGAGLLLDFGLRRWGIKERSARLAYGGNGKPFLADRKDVFFNLSHSGNLVMAAFSGAEVGCDVEQIKTADLRVARRFFALEEQAFLEGCTSEAEKNDAFFRLWTLKEAFMKATGEGARLPLSDFCVRLDQDPVTVHRKGEAPEAARQMEAAAEYVFFEYPLKGYHAAVCVRDKYNTRKTFFSFQKLADVVL